MHRFVNWHELLPGDQDESIPFLQQIQSWRQGCSFARSLCSRRAVLHQLPFDVNGPLELASTDRRQLTGYRNVHSVLVLVHVRKAKLRTCT
jgi:hypothetical protein